MVDILEDVYYANSHQKRRHYFIYSCCNLYIVKQNLAFELYFLLLKRFYLLLINSDSLILFRTVFSQKISFYFSNNYSFKKILLNELYQSVVFFIGRRFLPSWSRFFYYSSHNLKFFVLPVWFLLILNIRAIVRIGTPSWKKCLMLRFKL